jgi:hypothetical protein
MRRAEPEVAPLAKQFTLKRIRVVRKDSRNIAGKFPIFQRTAEPGAFLQTGLLVHRTA